MIRQETTKSKDKARNGIYAQRIDTLRLTMYVDTLIVHLRRVVTLINVYQGWQKSALRRT
jgi:hypothetical protein